MEENNEEKQDYKNGFIYRFSKMKPFPDQSKRLVFLILVLLASTVYMSIELDRANEQLLTLATQMNERLRLNNELVKRGAVLSYSVSEIERIEEQQEETDVPIPPVASYVRSFSPSFDLMYVEYIGDTFVLRINEELKKPYGFPLPFITDLYVEAVEASSEDVVASVSLEGTTREAWVYIEVCELNGRCYGSMVRVDLTTGREREIYSTYITENSIPGRDVGPLLYVSFEGRSDLIAQCEDINLNHFPVRDLILTNCETIHTARDYSSHDDSGSVRLYYDFQDEQMLPELVANLVEGELHLRFNNLLYEDRSISMYSIPKSRLGQSSVLILPR